MAFPKIICLKQMIILGVDLIDEKNKKRKRGRQIVCVF